MANYALVKESIVVNTVIWDGQTEVDFGNGLVAIGIPEGQPVSIGWGYEDGKFVEPIPTAEDLQQQEATVIAGNVATKDALMSEASQRISVLQDAIDLEMATNNEIAALPLWKKYRVLLSRIDAEMSVGIEWPTKPTF